eukprot:COSAG01_NODE_14_length_41020_cov_40.702133_21_plen_303_part_00
MKLLNWIKESTKLIKSEPLLLLPTLLFFFIYQNVSIYFGFQVQGNIQNFWTALVQFLLFGWLIELLFKSITLIMANQIINNNKLSIKRAIQELKNKGLDLILATAIFAIPVFTVFLKVLKAPEQVSGILIFIALIIVIIFSLMLPILPAILILDNLKWQESIKKMIHILKLYWINIISFMIAMLFINFVGMIIAEALSQIPVIGKGLLKIIVQGTVTAFIYILTLYFYIDLKKENNIKVNIQKPIKEVNLEEARQILGINKHTSKADIQLNYQELHIKYKEDEEMQNKINQAYEKIQESELE